MTGFRLEQGGLIDRATTLDFTFDGKRFSGHPGDTLASALIANGVHLMGRSFKYHRPRGVISAGAAEPNALVELREGGRQEANTRATMIELYDGLVAQEPESLAVARFRFRRHQFARLVDLRRRLLLQDLHVAEELLGEDLRAADPPRRGPGPRDARRPIPTNTKRPMRHCDLLVIGSGPDRPDGGARRPARSGARVILADEGAALGGSLLNENEEIDGRAGVDWAQGVIAELAALAQCHADAAHHRLRLV